MLVWLSLALPLGVTSVYCIALAYNLSGWYVLFMMLLNHMNQVVRPLNNESLTKILPAYFSNKIGHWVKRLSMMVCCGVIFFTISKVYNEPHSVLNQFLILASFVITLGTVCLSLGHELVHSKWLFDNILGQIGMLLSGIPLFASDHIFSHHKHASTPSDCSSPQLNQSIYSHFWLSGISRVKNSLTTYRKIPQGQIASNGTMLLIFITLILYLFYLQPNVGWFYICFCTINYIGFELLNYIQHYGLERTENEAMTLQHSWNSYATYSNLITYFLPIHSYHHLNTPIQQTDNFIGPELPFALYKMMLLALFPKYWFSVMNKRIIEVKKQDIYG